MNTIENLPDHKVPENINSQAELSSLAILGLVNNPHQISMAEWTSLTRVEITDDFSCLEGWEVKGLKWSGFRLSEVINLGKPYENARCVIVHGQDKGYQVPFPLSQAENIFLCDRLNDKNLPLEHGAPWRLIVPKGACFSSVKWVISLELTNSSGPNLGQEIALSRI